MLQNYTTYKTYYGLVKQVEEDRVLDKRKASRELARFISLHPHDLSQKTEVMVEHFRQNVMRKIGGRARAMVVTRSRRHAVRYRKAFDAYIKAQGYERDIKVLVAFSGSIEDQGQTHTEVEMNGGISERELPERFAEDPYRILIVANKYQTGFDQPLLHTMYIDRTLHGIQAVQTLSRLNRTMAGKEETFVLDFANRREDILESFKPYYEATAIEERLDPQKLYELQTTLDAFRIYYPEEVKAFGEIFFRANHSKRDHGKLNGCLAPASDRFNVESEEVQNEFLSTLTSYLRVYAFLSQVVPFGDAKLEMLYVFGRMLARHLKTNRDPGEALELGDDVALKYYRLEKLEEGAIGLVGDGKVRGPSDVATGSDEKEKKVELSRLIDTLNQRLGTEFTEADQLFFDQIEAEMRAHQVVQEAALANDRENFGYSARDVLEDVLLGRHEQNGAIIDRIFDEENRIYGETVIRLLLDRAYEGIREGEGEAV